MWLNSLVLESKHLTVVSIITDSLWRTIMALASDEDVREHFEDWIKLLKDTNNEDMLKDPFNIWLEAFHVATIVANRKPDA